MTAKNTLGFAGPGSIYLVERFPDAAEILLRYLDSLIVDADCIIITGTHSRKDDAPALFRIIDGIGKEVAENRINPFGIGVDDHFLRQATGELNVFFLHDPFEAAVRFFYESPEIKFRHIDTECPRFQPGQVKQVFYEMIHFHRLAVYDLAVMLPRRFIHIETVQPFGIALDKSQRGLQLMRHGRNEFLTHLFHFIGFFQLYFQFAVRLFEFRKGRVQLV